MNRLVEYDGISEIIQDDSKKQLLHLNFKSLSIIPEVIFKITDLVRLDLSHNDIDTLPNDIGNLINLEFLWLNHNPIKEIPKTISKCQNLIYIDLRNTALYTLPSELSLIPKLTTVNCENCDMERKLSKAIEMGTNVLLKYLRNENLKENFEKSLCEKLSNNLYFKYSLNQQGINKINLIVKMCSEKYNNEKDRISIIKLYEDIFPYNIDDVTEIYISSQLTKIRNDIRTKEIFVRIELKLRSFYFNKASSDIFGDFMDSLLNKHLDLYTIAFILDNFKRIFPAEVEGLVTDEILKITQKLIDEYKTEREHLKQSLVNSVRKIYSTQDENQIVDLSNKISSLIKKNEILRRFTNEIADYLTMEFDLINPKEVIKIFKTNIKSRIK